MEQDNKKKLITEKITGRKLTPERIIRFVIIAAVCGAVFGVTAAAAFGYIESGRKKQNARAESAASSAASAVTESEGPLKGESDASGQEQGQGSEGANAAEVDHGSVISAGNAPVSSSGTMTEAEPASSSGTTSEADPASDTDGKNSSQTVGTGTDADGENVLTEFFSNDGEAEYQNRLDGYLNRAASVIDSSLVSIAAAEQTATWFDNSAEDIRYYSGLVLKIDEREILILTTGEGLDKKKLKVTFCNGSTLDGYFKQYSNADGLSVIAVSATEGISEETLSSIQAVEYGNAEELEEGDMIIAAGSPVGVIGSSAFGTISYISDSEMHIDGEQLVFYSDIPGDSKKGTFIVDFEGKLVGITTDETSRIGVSQDITRIIGINSLRRVISSMLSGEKRTYLGVQGTEVGFGMKYNSIPEGIYLNDVIEDSPAYNVGIRRGDIIVELAERDVIDMDSFTRALNSFKPGQSVSLKVMRGSVNSEYHEMEYSVVLGER